ncbi:MAG: hypothetical protein ABFD79_11770, partial [Phycisphaerales bacterium]
MFQILLPINPEHIKNIFNGSKRYEFRKTRCRRPNICKLIMYATAPVMKVVGEAAIEEIIVDDPDTVWEQTRSFAGINREFFDQYFQGKSQAVAYKLAEVQEYPEPIALSKLGINYTPQ